MDEDETEQLLTAYKLYTLTGSLVGTTTARVYIAGTSTLETDSPSLTLFCSLLPKTGTSLAKTGVIDISLRPCDSSASSASSSALL